MRSWEKMHKPKLRTILAKIDAWGADYIVPVGRKSAKLFRSLGEMNGQSINRVFYKEYFRFCDVSVDEKKVAVVDDVARTCSTLADYRTFFEEKGAIVRTFAIAGHKNLITPYGICYDPLAEIEEYVSEPVYEDFLLSEAEFLQTEGFYQDINHLTLELEIPEFTQGVSNSLKNLLRNYGYVYAVPPYTRLRQKWSVIDPVFAKSPLLDITSGIVKLRFHGTHGSITCVPMVFPNLRITDGCQLNHLNTPFRLPCQMVSEKNHTMDELCYWSVSLLLSAELGRLFVMFLKEQYESSKEFVEKINNIHVRTIDFARYFGADIAVRLEKGIEQFLLKDDSRVDAAVHNYLSKITVPRYSDLLNGSFSEEALIKVVDHLREGYKKTVEMAGTHRGAHYSIPLSKMEEISGANELLLVESLDFLCDLGTLVPVTEVRRDSIERTWRTGETKEDTSLKRTYILIPLAINVIADELNAEDRKVGSVLLTKVLANFVYDYPSNPPLFDKLHRFIRVPDVHGTVPKVFHPFRIARPIGISKPEKLGNRYSKEVEEAVKGDPRRRFRRVWYKAKPDALRDLDEYFDNTQQITLDEITNYISFLAKLTHKTGSVDILTALSICRTSDSFYWHVYENLKLWTIAFNKFLQKLVIPYSEDVKNGPLHRSGEIVAAGIKKIDLWNDFGKLMKDMNTKMFETRFSTPLKKVSRNIQASRDLPILQDVKRILSIQRAMTGIALAQVSPSKRRSPDQVIRWANVEFQRNHFEFDISSISKANDASSIRSVLEPCYYQVCYLVQTLPEPRAESEEERNREIYLEEAQNRAVKYCLKNGWKRPTFVHWDLTDSRVSPNVVRRIASMYEMTDKAKSRFDGGCITVRPDGNDCLLFVFGSPIAALRAAASSMQIFVESNNPVKTGIAYASVGLDDPHSTLMATMGHAKDLCELKRQEFRNRTDIVVSTPLVHYLEKEGLKKDYFTELEGVELDTYIGQEKKRVQTFKFDWAKFYAEYRLGV